MLEVEAHPARTLGDDFLHVGIIGAVVRRAFRQQGLEGEDNVLGRYRLTVMKARLGTQMKADPFVVRSTLYFLGEQAVDGEWLIHAVGGQGVVDQADSVRGNPLVDEGVERIEAAKAGLAQGAALRRVGVGVVEMLEVGRVLGCLPVQGQCMSRCCLGRRGQAEQQNTGVQNGPHNAMGHWCFSRFFSHQVFSPSV